MSAIDIKNLSLIPDPSTLQGDIPQDFSKNP